MKNLKKQPYKIKSYIIDEDFATLSGDDESYNPDRWTSEYQAIVRYRQDTIERKLLSHWVVWIVSVWLGLTALILILMGCGVIAMSDVVVCMLLGTTTANILGLAYIVLKGLFPENSR